MIENYIRYDNTRRVQLNLGILTPFDKHSLYFDLELSMYVQQVLKNDSEPEIRYHSVCDDNYERILKQ